MTTNPRQILVATDFSSGSDEAFAIALDLAKQTRASLEIVHVLELGLAQFPFALSVIDDGGALINFAERELARREKEAAASGIAATTTLLEGATASEIVRRAADIGADLIVLGTHGRRGLAHAVLGSVAERVVEHADCPVLTVPFAKRAA